MRKSFLYLTNFNKLSNLIRLRYVRSCSCVMERKILILYGSQTGTAQDAAERIWRESRVLQFTGSVLCMDDYPLQELPNETLVIFVCSTTGQGEEPENMRIFWKFLLRKNLPTNSLQHMDFCVLGLGDSSYTKFNFVAKRLNRRLSDLGANRILDLGLADDQHDLGADAVVDPWIHSLWTILSQTYNFSYNAETLKNEVPQPRWSVNEVKKCVQIECADQNPRDSRKYNDWNRCEIVVDENKRTTPPEHYQDVRLITFDIPNDFIYTPGDVLMMSPENNHCRVKQLFKILNENRTCNVIDPNVNIELNAKDVDMPVPRMLRSQFNLEECATKYWDLNAVPRRYAFRVLSHVSDNPLEKEKLLEFCHSEGQEDLYNYCNRPKRNILEVLQDFPGAAKNISLEYLFEVIEPIRPRAFSIASSPLAHGNKLQILVAVIEYKTKLLTPRIGLCTYYLSSAKKGDTILAWIQKGSLKFPSLDTPCIMVGPGTGVAPFRSYINEVVASGHAKKDKLHLYFGARLMEADFYFRDEFLKMEKMGLLELHLAFSRDQPHKIYVQHKMAENGERLWRLLNKENAIVMVAGSSKNMPKGVRDAILETCIKYGHLNSSDAEKYIKALEFSGRYQTETWG